MRAAAGAEDETEKAPVTPGPIAPARELLGEMLLDVGRPSDALKEFEGTLRKEPNRFRAVYGAARAARLAGNRETAHSYYDQLLKICERADRPERAELQEARDWLTLTNRPNLGLPNASIGDPKVGTITSVVNPTGPSAGGHEAVLLNGHGPRRCLTLVSQFPVGGHQPGA